jgi:hypothetical protein
MPKKLTIEGFNAGETIDHYHKLDLTLEPNAQGSCEVDFLVTTGTVAVNIDAPGNFTLFDQLAETDNVLTTITITGHGVDLLKGTSKSSRLSQFVRV